MYKERLTALPTALLVAAALFVCQVAGAQIPVTGTETGTFAVTGFIPPDTVHLDLSGAGADTLGGSFTDLMSYDLIFADPAHKPIFNGLFTQTYGDGTLFGTLTGVASGTTGIVTLDKVVTGGTGAFAGMAGLLEESGIAEFTGPADGVYSFAIHGAVVPESSAVALLLGSGAAGGFLICRRRRPR